VVTIRLTYKWRLIMNYSLSDYLLCVDLQCGHLQCWNHVRTDVPRRNNNIILSVILSFLCFHCSVWSAVSLWRINLSYKVELTGIGNRSQINADDNIVNRSTCLRPLHIFALLCFDRADFR